MRTLADLPERLAAKIEPEPMSGCWLWTGSCDRRGYGKIWWDGAKRLAHRVTYELLDEPIPAGLELDHLCRNTSCVSPWHLEAVTHQVNNARGNARFNGRTNNANAAKTHCKRGHPYAGDNLYVAPRGGRECMICKREYLRTWWRQNKSKSGRWARSA